MILTFAQSSNLCLVALRVGHGIFRDVLDQQKGWPYWGVVEQKISLKNTIPLLKDVDVNQLITIGYYMSYKIQI